jgi:hypothetical protein
MRRQSPLMSVTRFSQAKSPKSLHLQLVIFANLFTTSSGCNFTLFVLRVNTFRTFFSNFFNFFLPMRFNSSSTQKFVSEFRQTRACPVALGFPSISQVVRTVRQTQTRRQKSATARSYSLKILAYAVPSQAHRPSRFYEPQIRLIYILIIKIKFFTCSQFHIQIHQ